ncbi:hypothetical protein [Sorangium sp. So ce1153]|uniref:hypothetical protein n=1 Tax=Sorangium sp. So ce1153 TaxID=3133333 RepID=UPI003F6224EC
MALVDIVSTSLILNIMGAVANWSDGWGPNLDWGRRGSLRALESAAHLESTIALIRDEETRRHLVTANEQRAIQLLDELTPERPELHVMAAQTLIGVAAMLPAGATRAAVLKRAARLVDGGDPRGA